MATRRFTEYIVHTRTFYKGEKTRAEQLAQEIADETGRPYRMKILSGWIQEDPSGFVWNSEVTSERTKTFRPQAKRIAANRRRRRNVAGGIDAPAARELELFIENDSNLYRSQYTPILKNLTLKRAKGIYRHDLAVKVFRYMVDRADKMYFSRRAVTTSTATRNAVADSLARGFEQEYDLGNYESLLPAKYQGKTNPRYVFGHQWSPAHVRVNNQGQVQIRIANPKSRRLGGGGKFASCVRQVSARGGAYDPKGVCAAAGMRKYGKGQMQRWARAGRRRAMRRR